jgi:diguanylate cyclase (GGDEF)-like protein/PAS domain S-box-containing protein
MLLSKARLAFQQCLDGDLTWCGGPAINPQDAGQIRLEQINAVLRSTPLMMAANILTAIILAFSLSNTDSYLFAYIWSSLICAMAAWGYYGVYRNRAVTPRKGASTRAMRRLTFNVSVLAFLWALAPGVLMTEHSEGVRITVSCLLAGLMSGGFALATVPAAMLSFEIILFTGSMIGLARHGEMIDLIIASLLLIYTLVVIRTALMRAVMVVENVVSRIEGERQRETIQLLLGEFEENASDWLWQLDQDLRLTHASTRFLTLMGLPLEELQGLIWRDVLTPGVRYLDYAERSSSAELARLLLEQKPFRDLIIAVQMNGETRWWSLTGKPMRDDVGDFIGFRGFGKDVTATKRAENNVERMGKFDLLTGLPNRRHFIEALTNALKLYNEQQRNFALLSIDVHRFRQINLQFGRRQGDEILRQIAQKLAACLRDGDMLARLGGEHFAVIRSGILENEDVDILAAVMEQSVNTPLDGLPATTKCEIVLGIVMASAAPSDAETMLEYADLALEDAKLAGPGSFRYFTSQMSQVRRDRRQMEIDLRDAITRGEFELDWQAAHRLSDGAILCQDAELIWAHPRRGRLSFSGFMSFAAELGLSGIIAAWSVREACAQIANANPKTRLSIRLSEAEIADPATLLLIVRALDASRLSPNNFEVRISSHMLNVDREDSGALWKAIASLGVRLCVEMNGPDLPSIDQLRAASVNALRMKDEVWTLSNHQLSLARLVQASELARTLGAELSIEDLLTSERLHLARSAGIDAGLGHGLAELIAADPAPVVTRLPTRAQAG